MDSQDAHAAAIVHWNAWSDDRREELAYHFNDMRKKDMLISELEEDIKTYKDDIKTYKDDNKRMKEVIYVQKTFLEAQGSLVDKLQDQVNTGLDKLRMQLLGLGEGREGVFSV